MCREVDLGSNLKMVRQACVLVTLLAAALVFTLSTDLGAVAQNSCGGSCNNLNDCAGQLICINGKCNDDPDIGTTTCQGSGGGGGGGQNTCPSTNQNTGSCCDRGTCQKVSCSPRVLSSGTKAKLTVNSFEAGGDGGGPSECDGRYHSNKRQVVALSTGWYSGGSRCGRQIRINGNGRSTLATVVDECDSENGCDSEHAHQTPSANNIVDGSPAVWAALNVSESSDMYGFMDVTWQDA